jgi:hypothetical protein
VITFASAVRAPFESRAPLKASMHSPLRRLRTGVICLLAFTSLASMCVAQQLCTGTTACVTTWHNDNNRTGWRPNETALTTTSVNQTNFGLLWQRGSPSSLYAATANGTFDLINANPLSNDAGDTLLKLNPSNLAILDWYTPSNVFTYNNNQELCDADEDFGSGVMSALVEVRSR